MGRVKRLRQSSNMKPPRKSSLIDGILSYNLEPFDQKNTSINNIENLSNEIIYEVFDYLDGYDIYKSFSDLNIRFENLLNSRLLCMKIQFYSKTVLDDRYQQFIKSNKHHIVSFHSFNESSIEKFISSCTIDSSFHRLESFIFDEISPFKLLIYLFHLKSLPRLFSLSIRLNKSYDHLGGIYQNLFRFRMLKYLKLKILDEQEVDITIPIASEGQFSPIEHFVIPFRCTLNELMDLLSYTPRISHLSCPNLVQSGEIFNSDVLMKLTNLVDLNVVIVNLDFEEFNGFLLNFCSQLKVLNIKIKSSDNNYLDGDRWERLISKKMTSLIKFIFCYTDTIYDDFGTNPDHSLINGFTSTFWIRRSWILRISIFSKTIQYKICPWLCEVEDIDIPMIDNSSLVWLYGAHLQLNNRYGRLIVWSQLFFYHIKSLLQTINIVHLDLECRQFPADLFIKILNLLPNLDMIRLSDLPSYEAFYECNPDINAINQFKKNNKITNIILTHISNFRKVDFIIHLFPRLQYFTLQYIRDHEIESIVQYTLLKIKEKNICQPMTICIFGLDAEYDKVQRLKQMIDSENLLNDYTISRQFNTFYLQWD